MNVKAYLITCLTNMHVGAGGANYGVVDNLVQRDPATGVPTIHSSSLKGALREFFSQQWGKNDEKLLHIFGPDTSADRNPNANDNIGHYKFFAGDLCVLPVRSNSKPFYRATSPFLIDAINTKYHAFNQKDIVNCSSIPEEENPFVKEKNTNLKLEDWEAKEDVNMTYSETTLGKDIAVFHETDFKQLAKKLPVIARNQLDNGQSKNLWYEEIVPRESRFICLIAHDDKYSDEFDKLISKNVIQIGANGSIGYGYCTFTELNAK